MKIPTYSQLNIFAWWTVLVCCLLCLAITIYMPLGGLHTSFAPIILMIGYLSMFPLIWAIEILAVNGSKWTWIFREYQSGWPAGSVYFFNFIVLLFWAWMLVAFLIKLFAEPSTTVDEMSSVLFFVALGIQVAIYVISVIAQGIIHDKLWHRVSNQVVIRD